MQRRVCHNTDAMPSVPTPSKPTGYSPPLLNSAMKAYIAERYVSFDVAPRDLVVELKQKFGLSIRLGPDSESAASKSTRRSLPS